MTIVYVVVALVVVVLAGFALSVRILKQYERAVIFRLGRVRDGARGPGLVVFVPFVDRVHRVSLRIITMPIQSQGIITRDNVSVDVSAVAYYRVADPIRSVVAIENASAAINQIAQTTLRAVVGRHTLDETLSETDTINQNIREILDVQTEEWGIQVTVVELRDIQLPESMQRAMARQAEAEREKRAKIIARRGRGARRRRAGQGVGRDDGPPAGAAAAQSSDLGRDLGRQELHGRLPGSADEHDPGARRLPQSRDRSGRRPARPARRGGAAQRRASSTLTSRRVAPRTRLGERRVRGVRVWISPRTGPRIADPGSAAAVVRLIRGLVACLGPDPAPSPWGFVSGVGAQTGRQWVVDGNSTGSVSGGRGQR